MTVAKKAAAIGASKTFRMELFANGIQTLLLGTRNQVVERILILKLR